MAPALHNPSVMRKIFVILGWLTAGVGSASGQEFLKREVFGNIGVGKTYDDEGSLGKGINGGGGFGYRLTHRFGVEAEINGFQTKRVFSPDFAPFRASGAFVLGNGLWYLNRGRAQIFLIGGVGMLHVQNRVSFAGSVDRSDNGVAMAFGAGVKIFVRPHILLRPEFRIYGGDSGQAVETPFTDMRFSMGVGYTW